MPSRHRTERGSAGSTSVIGRVDLQLTRRYRARFCAYSATRVAPWLTSAASIRKFKFPLLGGRPMVGLQTLDLAIGVRVPASQPKRIKDHPPARANVT